jgi:hypothetical protein
MKPISPMIENRCGNAGARRAIYLSAEAGLGGILRESYYAEAAHVSAPKPVANPHVPSSWPTEITTSLGEVCLSIGRR